MSGGVPLMTHLDRIRAEPLLALRSPAVTRIDFPIGAQEFANCRTFLNGYRAINVYSDYARMHTVRALSASNLPAMPVEVIYPPVAMIGGDATQKKNVILSVGRFFIGGHGKRQDVLIEAFRDLLKACESEVELHLAGSSVPEPLHMAYLRDLHRMADGLPVKFHVNPTKAVLSKLYRDAAIYWHATGLHCDLEREPQKAEHFGISIVEAMSTGTVPLAFNAGGPREIVTSGVDGFLYETTDVLVELTAGLLRGSDTERRVAMGRAASNTAERYKVVNFIAKVRQLVKRPSCRQTSPNEQSNVHRLESPNLPAIVVPSRE